MNISKFLVLFFVAISIASCKKDDGPDQTIDTDGDGIVDVNDLCPNEVGTAVDNGCYFLTNVNIAGTHDFEFYAANKVTSGTVGGTTFTVEDVIAADSYQASISFTEAGAFTLTGEFRIITTTTGSVDPPIIRIVVLDESGTYQLNDGAKILTFAGSGVYADGIYNVTMFDQDELNFTKEENTTDTNGDPVVKMEAFRFTR